MNVADALHVALHHGIRCAYVTTASCVAYQAALKATPFLIVEFENQLAADELRNHLASEHGGLFDGGLRELQDAHEHEHDGPGTIRNHPRASRAYDPKEVAEILREVEQEDA